MARKKKDDNGLLLLLLLLGLSGLRGIGVPRAPDMSMPPAGGGIPSGSPSNPSTPEPSNPNQQGIMKTIMNMMNSIGQTAQGIIDKGTPISGFGTTPIIPSGQMSHDNAGVTAAIQQVQAIGGLTGGGFRNLPDVFTGMINSLASITTAIFNPRTGKYETYTNNPITPSTIYPPSSNPPMMKSNSVSPQEAIKQPIVHPQILAIDTTGGLGEVAPRPPMTVSPQPLPNLLGSLAMVQTNIRPPPAVSAAPSSYELQQMTKVTNPLHTQDNLLSGLQSFGQASLNELLKAGNSLSGLFNNLQGFAPIIQTPRPLVDLFA